MLMSMIWAPFSNLLCGDGERGVVVAFEDQPLERAEPVMLVRSPTVDEVAVLIEVRPPGRKTQVIVRRWHLSWRHAIDRAGDGGDNVPAWCHSNPDDVDKTAARHSPSCSAVSSGCSS